MERFLDAKGFFFPLSNSSDDMLATLFPHLVEDLEYLVPSENDVMMEEVEEVGGVVREMSQMHVNAEAGPSRLG